MRMSKKVVAIMAAVAVLAGAGAGGAVAAGGNGKTATKRAALRQRVHRGLIRTVTDYLGISRAQLRTEWQSGKSLSQIATEHGKTADGLKQAILTTVKTRLDRAVANGRLSPAREQAFLTRFSSRLDTFLTKTRQ
jgi:hypothetical protein